MRDEAGTFQKDVKVPRTTTSCIGELRFCGTNLASYPVCLVFSWNFAYLKRCHKVNDSSQKELTSGYLLEPEQNTKTGVRLLANLYWRLMLSVKLSSVVVRIKTKWIFLKTSVFRHTTTQKQNKSLKRRFIMNHQRYTLTISQLRWWRKIPAASHKCCLQVLTEISECTFSAVTNNPKMPCLTTVFHPVGIIVPKLTQCLCTVRWKRSFTLASTFLFNFE